MLCFTVDVAQRDYRGVAPADCWNWGEWGPSLVGSLGLSCWYKKFLFCLGWSSRLSTKYFFPHRTLFELLCPHCPASCARQPCWVACLLVRVSGVAEHLHAEGRPNGFFLSPMIFRNNVYHRGTKLGEQYKVVFAGLQRNQLGNRVGEGEEGLCCAGYGDVYTIHELYSHDSDLHCTSSGNVWSSPISSA